MSTKKIISKSSVETKKIAAKFADQILQLDTKKSAIVLGLQGDLGAGKTTFLQGFGKSLGITEKINSPTFVIMKRFKLKGKYFKNFYHFDCYRLKNEKDLEGLGFKEIVSDPQNIVAIEWPEKIDNVLPKEILKIIFKHLKQNKREIIFKFKLNMIK